MPNLTENQPGDEISLELNDVVVGYDEEGLEIELRAVALVTDPNTKTEYLVLRDELNDAYALAERNGWLVEDETFATQMIESVLTPAIVEA